ncbi:NAD-binding protein [Roridomyces roridus]|uniref:NAD-binding protein n=1 Tax=Roridomyces roridus TaxID=1738132 RepID=A0AAD7BYC3_9AGAR|nr:NAD-binding protein [Roridomyces roridus]
MSTKGVAFVTGAARGIGKAIALRLAEDGFDVAVNDLATASAQLDVLVEEIKQKGRTSSSHTGDVSKNEDVKNMVAAVVQIHGSLDVMVANAGTTLDRNFGTSILELTPEDWDQIMGVNARGTFLCYQHAAVQMIKQGRGGRMIGACSVLGKQIIMPDVGAYASSKAAVRALTQAAALEFGKYGITVNAYAPGAVDTQMLMGTDAAIANGIREHFKARSPLNVVGTPQDVAHVVSFLAAKESHFITGQAMSVNGGLYFD